MLNFSTKYGFTENICDNHFHTKVARDIDEILETLKKQMTFFSLEKVLLCSLPFEQIADNAREFYLKSKLDGVYVAPALFHHCDERDTKEYYLEQIKAFHRMGCDAIKMLEGKLTTRRRTKRRIDDELFDDYYAYAEENKIPITLHVGDPARFWNPEQCTEVEIQRGWAANPDDASLEQLRAETERVLEKFPKITLNIAHCYFMGNDIKRMSALLDKYENLYYDLAPGPLVFADLSDAHDEAKSFFETYADRIIYGTDTWTVPFIDSEIEQMHGRSHRLVRTFLEGKEPFTYSSLGDKKLYPLSLDENALTKIYRSNFDKVYGEKPKALNVDAIVEYLEDNKSRLVPENEIDTFNKAFEYFKSL